MNKKIRKWRIIRSLSPDDEIETPPDTPILLENTETGEKIIDYGGDYTLITAPSKPAPIPRIVQKITVTPIDFGRTEKLTVPYGIQIDKVVQLLYPEIESKQYVIRRASTGRPLKPHSKVKYRFFDDKPEKKYFHYTVEIPK